MPASSKIKTGALPKKLGVIAGGGKLPQRLLSACDANGIETFVIAFEGQTNPEIVRGYNHLWSRLGAAGKVIDALRSHDIEDLVLIGSIRRPTLSELRPDLKTAQFFTKIGMKALGDNDLLSTIRETLEDEGFNLHGVHKFAQDLLVKKGALGRIKPKKADIVDIARGLEVSQELGGADVGQSVIVQEGIVLGVEAAEGTDELIRRCKHLKRKGRKGILVKTCKPQQDRDFDLPTIGPETILNAIENDLAGVVVHAGLTLVLEPDVVAEIADQHKVFVIAVDPKTRLEEQL